MCGALSAAHILHTSLPPARVSYGSEYGCTERSSVAKSARSLLGVAPPMHGLDVLRMVISPGSSHSFRVSVVRYDVAAVGKFMVANGALPGLLDDFSVE